MTQTPDPPPLLLLQPHLWGWVSRICESLDRGRQHLKLWSLHSTLHKTGLFNAFSFFVFKNLFCLYNVHFILLKCWNKTTTTLTASIFTFNSYFLKCLIWVLSIKIVCTIPLSKFFLPFIFRHFHLQAVYFLEYIPFLGLLTHLSSLF